MARRIRPLTPERVADLPGACTTCVVWDAPSTDLKCGSAQDSARRKAWVAEVLSEWGDCGRVAYAGDTAIGFVQYAPPRFLPRSTTMEAGSPSDDAVLLACMHVDDEARHVGLGKVLLMAAFRDLATRGEKALEAYAASGPFERSTSPLMTVEFLLKQGFVVVRPHPRYPLMRLEMRTLAAWTENVEAVLESLQLPLLKRERVPAPLGGS
jgi:GNAT superfamily N-acetyltransferase